MELNSLLIGLGAGGVLGALIFYFYFRGWARRVDAAFGQRLVDKDAELERSLNEIARLHGEEERLGLEMNRLVGEWESAKAALRYDRESAREKIQLLDESKQQLGVLFENTANKIVEEKTARLTGQSVERLQEVLKPLKDQLGDFKKKVEDVYDKEGRERSTLLLTLHIIAAMWRTEYQNRNALEIAKRGKLLYEKLIGFVEDRETVGSAIEKAGVAYRDAHGKLTAGGGNLIGQANKLIDLGVKARKRLAEESI